MNITRALLGLITLFVLVACVPPVTPVPDPIIDDVVDAPTTQKATVDGLTVTFHNMGQLADADVTKIDLAVQTADFVDVAHATLKLDTAGELWKGTLDKLPKGSVTVVFSAQNSAGRQLSYGHASLTWSTTASWDLKAFSSTEALAYTAVAGGYEVKGTAELGGGTVVVPAYWLNKPVVALADNAFYIYGEYTTTFSAIELPETMTKLGVDAFEENTNLTALDIPDGVTVIPNSLVNGCSALVSVDLPPGLTTIGDWAFYGTGLTTVTFPTTVTTIGEGAFYDSQLAGTITLPANLTKVAPRLFTACPNLTQVVLPAGLTEIGSEAFKDSALQTASLPSSLTVLGAHAFAGTDLTAIVLPAGMTTVPEASFEFCADLESVTIPASITDIADYAFHGCDQLTTVTFSGTSALTSIGSAAFQECADLAANFATTLPNTVESIGMSAFTSCTSLTALKVPSGVTFIDQGAFQACTSLVSIDWNGAQLQSIKTYAFEGCTALTTPDLEQLDGDLQYLDFSAFAHCTQLVNVVIPASVIYFGPYAFSGCTSLDSIEFQGPVAPSFSVECFATSDADPTPLAGLTLWVSTSQAQSDYIAELIVDFDGAYTTWTTTTHVKVTL